VIFVPFRIGERIDESARLAPGETAEPQLPADTPEERLAALYSALAGMVAVRERPRVQAGDCVASLGVAAGSVTSWNPQLDGAERSRAVALELLDGLL
jgi:hypothetical protein